MNVYLIFVIKIVYLKYLFVIIFFLFTSDLSKAQQDSVTQLQPDTTEKDRHKPIIKESNEPNTIGISDTGLKQEDTIVSKVTTGFVKIDSVKKGDKYISTNYDSILPIIGLPVFATPKTMLTPERFGEGKEYIFYVIAFIIFLLALVRVVFPNYLQNTMGLFFQTTGINANTKYMAQQNGIAFVLMQLVFVFCGAVYITVISTKYFHYQYGFWQLLFFSSLFLIVVYVGKYIAVKLLGWIFDLQNEAKIYLLFVFLVNRVVAIILLPVVLVLAFSNNDIAYFAFIFSFFLLAALLAYRYFLTIKTVRPRLQAKTIQIFLYLCTIEILPIVLLYKLIITYVVGMN